MGSSSDVIVEIDRSTTGGTFTNYDIIKGTVTLVVTSSISLNYIQVKLEGVSRTELRIPQRKRNPRDRDRKDRYIQDVHKVLYDTSIVFPPENIRQVSSAKEFTLTPGNYTYPFEFKIPLNNSCVKLSGITNRIQFNKTSQNIIINNGNFNTSSIKNISNEIRQAYQGNGNQVKQQSYHVTTQLPPSLSGIGDFASVRYFIKVTCKRSSFLKTNLRAYDPFIFLPLDLDSHFQRIDRGEYEEYREVFVRKELIFKDRIPEIVGVKIPPQVTEKKTLPKTPNIPPKKPTFFQKLFDAGPQINGQLPPVPYKQPGPHSYYPEIQSKDVPFSFEVRFRYPAFLIPTKTPSFKLYLVSLQKPQRYTLSEYGRPEDSNGLGVVYLQRLKIELTSTTLVSVLETDGSYNEIHTGQHEEVIQICNNTYKNLKFDLKNCKKMKSSSATGVDIEAAGVYELEIPKKYFENCVLPDHLSPSFKTCNITRRYNLSIVGGFSCEKIVDFNSSRESQKKIKYVNLDCENIKVLSGLNMTSTLHSNASQPSLPRTTSLSSGVKRASSTSVEKPPLPVRQSFENSLESADVNANTSNSNSNSEEEGELPTYDDVVRESTYQDRGEHIRARRRYQQHEQYYNNLE
ncbi:uncharacterized protein RJT20DRAFT_57366 [Scheffersomyces xylosifermentans]|uniref:uncharacterized protein n=1 Tax=Scheffersomyces xylosifermentans TaxID=1304137 RepID=UPI00315D431E